jgi:hypothetical protein
MRDERNGVVKLVPQKSLEGNLPLILGEFFYQLRASLDGAVWEAYRRLGGRKTAPDLNEERLDFPILKKPRNFKECPFNIFPFPQKIRDWVESIQPYNVQNLAKGSKDHSAAVNLHLINDCARLDRHRMLHIVGTVVSGNTALITVTDPATITYVQNIVANPFQDEYEIATFGIEGVTAETKILVNGNFTIGVAVKEIPDDTDLMIRLFQLKDTVLETVIRFEKAVQ